MRFRPTLVTVVALLLGVVGFGVAVAGVVTLVTGTIAAWGQMARAAAPTDFAPFGAIGQGISLIVLGAIYAIACRANLVGALYGWWLTVLLGLGNAVAALVDLANGRFLALWNIVVFGALVALYLRPDVREHFRVDFGRGAPVTRSG